MIACGTNGKKSHQLEEDYLCRSSSLLAYLNGLTLLPSLLAIVDDPLIHTSMRRASFCHRPFSSPLICHPCEVARLATSVLRRQEVVVGRATDLTGQGEGHDEELVQHVAP